MKTLRINPQDTHEWILKKHYAHRLPCITDAFGLYDDGVLRGVCTFGIPASKDLCAGVCGEKYRNNVRELNRLCIDDEYSKTHKNCGSFFVGCCLRSMHIPGGTVIVSYADTGMGHHGYIYQACNFKYTGMTKERTDIYTGEGKHSRHYDKNQDKTQNRKIRTAKHRYVYFCGRGRYLKDIKNALKYEVLPYPKGDQQRYNANYQTQDDLLIPGLD